MELKRFLNPALKFQEVCGGDREDLSIKGHRLVQSAYMPKHVIRLRKKIGSRGTKGLTMHLMHTNYKSHLQYYSKINKGLALQDG